MKKLLSFIIIITLTIISLPRGEALFDDTSLWKAYNPGYGTNGTDGFDAQGFDPDGMEGAAFDGRYLYFSQNSNGDLPTSVGAGGEILRYDTTADFESQSSWEIFDPGDNVVGSDPDGFFGVVFDGRYVYFVPFEDGSATRSGEFLRYDTTGAFDSTSSWSAVDISDGGILGSSAKGFYKGIYDGEYIYFTPHYDASAPHKNFVRYDPNGAGFSNASSWSLYNYASAPGSHTDVEYDGRYLYVSSTLTTSGVIVRYDTEGAGFTNAASWTTYDPGANGVGTDPDGFEGVTFDGQYMYFSPDDNGSGYHGEVLRYNTEMDFDSTDSWEAFDPSSNGLGTDARGFAQPVYDGEYIYFPARQYGNTGDHNVFMVYDISGAFNNIASWEKLNVFSSGITSASGAWSDPVYFGDKILFLGTSTTNKPDSEHLLYNTRAKRYHWVGSNERVSAEAMYEISFIPIVPIEDGSTITLSFTDAFDAKFDGGGDDITNSDISVTGTNLASTSSTIDDVNNRIDISLTTTSSLSITSEITITIGDGLSGSLNDITNPSTAGRYSIGVIVKDSSAEILEKGHTVTNIGPGSSAISTTAVVSEALVMALNSTSISLQVDPSVNGGEDKSEGTILTVASNASGGYSIYGKLDDGSGNAQLVSGANSIASSTGENGFSYDATNNASSCSSPDGSKTFASSAAVLQNSSSQDVGYTEETDSYQHALCYDLNVNYNTPAGVYTGTITYTVVASF